MITQLNKELNKEIGYFRILLTRKFLVKKYNGTQFCVQCSGDVFSFFDRFSWFLDASRFLDASKCLRRCPSKESMASHWLGERSDQDETTLAEHKREHKRRRRNSNGAAGATGSPRGLRNLRGAGKLPK